MDDIENEINKYQEKYDSLLPQGYKQIQEEVKKVTDSIPKFDFSPIYKRYTEITAEIGKQFTDNLSNIFDELEKTLKPLKDLLKLIPETYTNYKTLLSWADYGWALIDDLPKEETYFISVNNVKEADNLIEQFISEEIINNLIQKTEENTNADLYFVEAKNCFYEEKYLSCILILFSMIDGICVNAQLTSSQRRKLADKFAKKILESEDLNEISISQYIRIVMPLKAIKVLFADGNDFISEPDFPNRNFLLHGMSKRKVTKIDCIKVLSVLNNLLEIEEIIKEDTKQIEE